MLTGMIVLCGQADPQTTRPIVAFGMRDRKSGLGRRLIERLIQEQEWDDDCLRSGHESTQCRCHLPHCISQAGDQRRHLKELCHLMNRTITYQSLREILERLGFSHREAPERKAVVFENKE